MLTRIISAVVAIVIFIAVVYFLPPLSVPIALSIICAVASYELTWRSGIVKVKTLSVAAITFAAATPFFIYFEVLEKYIFALLFMAVAVMFLIWLLKYGKASLVMVLSSFFGAVIIPMLISLILKVYQADQGKWLILMPFLVAWTTDTGAYFVGVLLGRHKLCEKISPKKTVEGAIGGIVCCIISLVIYAMVMKLDVNYVAFGFGALVLSVIAQIGDLSFSVIKREYNIKDYGVIMPGHGGVLDRFDSVIFTIPATYILLTIIGGIK